MRKSIALPVLVLLFIACKGTTSYNNIESRHYSNKQTYGETLQPNQDYQYTIKLCNENCEELVFKYHDLQLKNGTLVITIRSEGDQEIFSLSLDASSLPENIYYIDIDSGVVGTEYNARVNLSSTEDCDVTLVWESEFFVNE